MKITKSVVLKEIDKRKSLFSHYYDNFEKHLLQGKISKASEFLWGAVHCLISAISITYNKSLGGHRETMEFSRFLSEEERDPLIFKWIKMAEKLHSNFYNNIFDKDDLILYREDVDKLIDKLGIILNKRIEIVNREFVEDIEVDESVLSNIFQD